MNDTNLCNLRALMPLNRLPILNSSSNPAIPFAPNFGGGSRKNGCRYRASFFNSASMRTKRLRILR